MKCEACKQTLTQEDAMRVDGREAGKDIVFYVHRPSIDGRCFSRVVLGPTDRISLVVKEITMNPPSTTPYHCPLCPDGDFYGKLLFENDEVPACPNPHYAADGTTRIEVLLVPA
jgi:hypothetical protein